MSQAGRLLGQSQSNVGKEKQLTEEARSRRDIVCKARVIVKESFTSHSPVPS